MKLYELLTESKKPEPAKPRNFVAKNAKMGMGGAGAHKDKKKAAKQGDVKHKKPIHMDEAYGRRSSYYNPMDQERDQQRQMDYDKRAFKRAELQHELGHEDDPDFERKLRQQQMDRDRGPWYLKVNGKILKTGGQPKVFDWKKGANNYALAILKNKPELQGKIFLTKKGEDDVAEDAGIQALDAWKQEVLQAYPQFAGKIKFLGRDSQVSAEIPGLDRSFGVFDLDTETGEVLGESATAGATSSGNVAVGAVYKNKPGKTLKNKDGTAKNALDMKGVNLLTGGSIKR